MPPRRSSRKPVPRRQFDLTSPPAAPIEVPELPHTHRMADHPAPTISQPGSPLEVHPFPPAPNADVLTDYTCGSASSSDFDPDYDSAPQYYCTPSANAEYMGHEVLWPCQKCKVGNNFIKTTTCLYCGHPRKTGWATQKYAHHKYRWLSVVKNKRVMRVWTRKKKRLDSNLFDGYYLGGKEVEVARMLGRLKAAERKTTTKKADKGKKVGKTQAAKPKAAVKQNTKRKRDEQDDEQDGPEEKGNKTKRAKGAQAPKKAPAPKKTPAPKKAAPPKKEAAPKKAPAPKKAAPPKKEAAPKKAPAPKKAAATKKTAAPKTTPAPKKAPVAKANGVNGAAKGTAGTKRKSAHVEEAEDQADAAIVETQKENGRPKRAKRVKAA